MTTPVQAAHALADLLAAHPDLPDTWWVVDATVPDGHPSLAHLTGYLRPGDDLVSDLARWAEALGREVQWTPAGEHTAAGVVEAGVYGLRVKLMTEVLQAEVPAPPRRVRPPLPF